MKCPNDQTEMTPTILIGNDTVTEIKLRLKEGSLGGLAGVESGELKAWYCSSCGKVELQAQPDLEVEKEIKDD